jgi:hypothetical protein
MDLSMGFCFSTTSIQVKEAALPTTISGTEYVALLGTEDINLVPVFIIYLLPCNLSPSYHLNTNHYETINLPCHLNRMFNGCNACTGTEV